MTFDSKRCRSARFGQIRPKDWIAEFPGSRDCIKDRDTDEKKNACATIVTIIKRFIQYIGFHILRMHESHRVSFAQLMNITDKSRLTF